MIIKTMYATFGKLEEARIDLTDGLNVIYGENESGKSTWSAFLRVMLYGISTREKSKIGFLADKEKYAPWSGKPMYGKIEFSWQGKDYVMERCAGKNGVLQDAKITEVETGKILDIPEPVGETLLGIRREVFERTAFIAQAQLAISGDKTGELEKKICALATTGEEDVSQKQVINRLEKEKRLLRYNKKGEIPLLEEEISRINETITVAREEAAVLTQLHAEIQQLSEAETAAIRDIECAKVMDARENLAYISEVEGELNSAYQALDAHEKSSTLTDNQVAEIENKFKQFEEKERNYTNCCERLSASRQAETRGIPEGPGIMPLVLGAICALLSCALAFVLAWYIAVPMAIIVFAAVFLAATRSAYKKAGVKNKAELKLIREEGLRQAQTTVILEEERKRCLNELSLAEENLNSVLNMVGNAYSPEDAPKIIANAREHKENGLSLRRKAETCKAKYDALKSRVNIAELKALAEKPIEKAGIPESEEVLRQKISGIVMERETKARQIAALEERIAARGELGALEARYEELSERLSDKTRDYEALCIASDLVSEIQNELARRFAPTVEEQAGEIFRYLTGEHFKIVHIEDAEMNLKVLQNEATPARNILELSGGTLDELYLSVRLALSQALLSEETPVLLDDALVNFDDKRAERMLNLLEKMAEKRQIMLFTCHLREAELLKNKKATAVFLG